MAGVTTIALLEKRADITNELFSRYWRDVHGVMATRIPGFASYVQYHVSLTRGFPGNVKLSGIAVVEFDSANDRAQMTESPIVPEIVRDEPNVFGRVMLLALEPHDTVKLNEGSRDIADTAVFLLFKSKKAGQTWGREQAAMGSEVHLYNISKADPSLWNGIDPSNKCWDQIVLCWPNGADLCPLGEETDVYQTDARHALVENGFATPVGLRGADAVRTIHEAGASNQLENAVEKLIFKL